MNLGYVLGGALILLVVFHVGMQAGREEERARLRPLADGLRRCLENTAPEDGETRALLEGLLQRVSKLTNPYKSATIKAPGTKFGSMPCDWPTAVGAILYPRFIVSLKPPV